MVRKHLVPLVVFALLAAVGLVARMAPHPPNFSPVAGLALFAGFFFRDWRVAAGLPVAVLLVSDYWIGGYEPALMIVVYASLTLPIALRALLRARLTATRVAFSALACSVTFFVCTNLAVWLTESWYPRTLEGLAACMAAALPFFKYTVAGDLGCSCLLFGCYALVQRVRASLPRERGQVAVGQAA